MAKKKAPPSKPVRVDLDLAEMVDFVVEWRSKKGEKLNAAIYVSPMIRDQVEADYDRYKEEEFEQNVRERRERRKRT